MAITIQRLQAEVGADVSGYDRAMRHVETTGQRVAGTMRAVGSAIAIGGVGALAIWGREAVRLGSNLEEQANKVRVVFGPASGAVEAFAATSVRSLGLARNEALQAAGQFGQLFSAMDPQRAAAMSTTMAKLAVDLGSFNNVATGDAIQALQSGLSLRFGSGPRRGP